MIVPLTLADFLERAEHVYGDREAIVDEPNPPGGGLGRLTYGQFAAMSRDRISWSANGVWKPAMRREQLRRSRMYCTAAIATWSGWTAANSNTDTRSRNLLVHLRDTLAIGKPNPC